MTSETLSEKNLEAAVTLILALWPECSYDEEFENCKRILKSAHETIVLAKVEDEYAGFIYLSLRTEYVEGTSTSPVAYIEGLYVTPQYRNQGIAKALVNRGEQWGKTMGAREYASDTGIENQQSISVHHKLGFVEARRIVCFTRAIE